MSEDLYKFRLYVSGDDSETREMAEQMKKLLEENILAVPGTGFKGPGYFRLSYCCSRETARHSLPGFKRAIDKVRGV